ncbi:protein arginine methyltransferase NDUFAF7, mitochondrial isoform X1 [Frankliniella occidentalis]|uniref:Protein arginine methyltransferase NDUFAF7 n=1 Tax=Frankliniella occidentalis TaxID=133901 RepID=A0A6J1S2H6_FRAOC|nr:protein arginine methyltransferase NDUFAF7, mitochondrial isoform X1 [Frankliniella occidentalis]XP_052120735.1 protein arginine methyltransferase NDUFAF7, mitochondrial isoform X1 [Frankliniella occidentalis]
MAMSIRSTRIFNSKRESFLMFFKKGARLLSASSSKYTIKPQKNHMTIAEQIRARIEVRGPLSVADYMRAVLTSPSGGYYMYKDVLGRQGDFTTSPEISQLFGDMVGVWYVNELKKFHAPSQPLQLVELGPGRGTLIADVLNVFKLLRGKEGLSVHLVEISPEFSRIQAEKLCQKGTVQQASFFVEREVSGNIAKGRKYGVKNDDTEGKVTGKKSSFSTITVERPSNLVKKTESKHYQEGVMDDGTPVYWYYSLSEVPNNFSCFLAHEFFDALPVHKFKKTPEGWREILVTTDTDRGPDCFKFVISRFGTPASKIFMKPWDEREEVEVCPDSGLIAQQIAARLEAQGGAALIIDYGSEDESCDTFRAFKQHQQVDPLVSPGTADLTADVDFTYLRNAVSDKALAFGPVSQSHFLKEVGIDLRLKSLLEQCPNEQKSQLESGYKMLMESMGERFKFFALFPNILKDHLQKFPVAGFPKL